MNLDLLAWRTSSFSGDNGGSCVEVAPVWRTSSFSGGNGGSCVEVAPIWRTSTFTGENGGSCVEVAPVPEGIAVRDTKDRTLTPHVHSAQAWADFVTGVRTGAFDA